MSKVKILKAVPPNRMAKVISKIVMYTAFFHPNSLVKAAIVDMHGM